MERLPLLKALLLSTVLAVCSCEPFVVDASKQITQLFGIFIERQATLITDLKGIKDILTDIEITRGTSNAALEEIKTKLDNLDVTVGQAKGFCEISNDVLGSFVDVLSTDECETGAHICHENANCVNLLIEYQCVCKEGFSGDGETCIDADECAEGTHQCDSHASCSNHVGNYSCSCHSGYYGDGYTCEERKSCSNDRDCQPHSSCKNDGGNKYCFCMDGYLGDGRTCEDVNECENDSHECHRLATCKNTLGSYSCICNPGFQGDGRTCGDADECQGSHDCPSVASCSNTFGSFYCSCNSGYLGDGYTCEDVDECEENRFECRPNASCKNIPGSYTCQCNPGFQGDGHTCEDVDECLVGHDCHSNATCSNNVGSFSCSCKPGYQGDGYQCEDMCPFDRVHGAGCILFDEEEKTWADAWDNCQKYGSHLFLARTVTQFSRLRQYLKEKTPIAVPDWTGLWVGVQQKTWLDGRVVSNEEWNDEYCHSSGYCCGAVMAGPPNYRLHNDPCAWTRPFICQWNETSSQLDF